MTNRPVSFPLIDIELAGMVDQASVLIAPGGEEQLALELAREYARFLMGHRQKSPAGDGLSIMQNQYVRSETWRIIRRHGRLYRDADQWRRYMEERGRILF